ncbi:MAG TPA: NAD-dependent epimerase/dehydratase family protein [Longimicrobiales bacterium]|nr:NAD-dependent epimerase/dehydratase family protein [Longimicrobiales bacterium]
MTGRVLVTGANGFLGSALCRQLHASGVPVRGAVRNAASPIPAGVEGLAVGELGDHTEWRAALDGVAVVVHTAGRAHRRGRKALDEEAFDRVNHRAVARLADQVADAGSVRRLVLVSSIAAVAAERERGGPSAAGEVEGGEAVSTPYGRSKLSAEAALAARLSAGLPDWCVLRPPLVYGPGNPGNMRRLLRMVRVLPVVPLGGIRNRRSFVYIDNLIDAIVTVATAPGASRRVFTVADDESVSTPELVRMLATAVGRQARLISVPDAVLFALARAGDLARALGLPAPITSEALERLRGTLVVRTEALRAATDWRPRVRLADGLRATVAAS